MLRIVADCDVNAHVKRARIVRVSTDDRIGAAFADAVRMNRAARRWTQTELAAKWNTSRASIAKIENGERRVTVADLYTACLVFECDADTFLTRHLEDAEHTREIVRVLATLFPDIEKKSTTTRNGSGALLCSAVYRIIASSSTYASSG